MDQIKVYQTNCITQNCTICTSKSIKKNVEVSRYAMLPFDSDMIDLYKGNFFILLPINPEGFEMDTMAVRINYVSYVFRTFSVSYNKVGNYTLNSTAIIDSLSPKLVKSSSKLIQVVPGETSIKAKSE